VSTRLEQQTLDMMDAAAARMGINRSEFIERAIQSFALSVQQIPPTPEEERQWREHLADGDWEPIAVVRQDSTRRRRSRYSVEFDSEDLFRLMDEATRLGVSTGELIRQRALASAWTACSGGAVTIRYSAGAPR
jgi:hypothetical protein